MPGKIPTSLIKPSGWPKLAIIFIALFYLISNLSHHKWTKDEHPRGVINADKISYYAYLPATFIYGDVSLGFLNDPPEGFKNDNKFWYSKLENGNKLIITSMGLSILYSPFFFMAHALAPVFNEPQTGYSSIYQFFLIFSAFVYVMLGFVILYNFLKRYFSPQVVTIVLLAIGLGTNLYFYATDQGPMSHSYNFFLLTAFLWMIPWWYKNPGIWKALALGGLLGFISLVRPTNILIFFVLFLWDVKSLNELGQRTLFYLKKFPLVIIMLLAFILAWMPQFLYWKEITGHYIFFSYGEEGGAFYWAHPNIRENLFSYRKGWFVYTPIMLFAVAGIGLLRKRIPGLFLPLIVFTLAMVYVQSSWWSWWFGGGFGLRAYVDMYGLMAIPLAAVLEYAFKHSKKAIRIGIPTAIIVLMFFQLQQHWQYRKNIIHYVGMHKELYWKSFLKFKRPATYWVSLSLPDHRLARKSIYVYYDSGREGYDEITAMEESEGLQTVVKMIHNDKKLLREVSRYSEREEISVEEAVSEVAERMYFRITNE
jgi:hypothetical protein